jgi:hypothetical protein
MKVFLTAAAFVALVSAAICINICACYSQYFAYNRPRVAHPEQGMTVPLQVHMTHIFITEGEHKFLQVTFTVGLSSIALMIVLRAISVHMSGLGPYGASARELEFRRASAWATSGPPRRRKWWGG